MIPTLEQKLAWLKPVPAAAGDGASTRPLGLGDRKSTRLNSSH